MGSERIGAWALGARVVVAIGVLVQIVATFQFFIAPLRTGIWETRHLPAWQRSAAISSWVSPDQTGFLEFLPAETPSDSSLAFLEPPGLIAWRAPLKYILFPRRITTCPTSVEACLSQVLTEKTYVVVAPSEPPPALLTDRPDFTP